MSLLDLYRLRVEYNERSHTWGVGVLAERELLLARDTCGAYLVNHLASGGPKCLGLSVQVDDQLSPGRIELRDRDGRVLGAIEGVEGMSSQATTTKPWSEMDYRERNDLVARHLFGHATLWAEDDALGGALWLHDVEAVCDDKGRASNCRLLGGRCERIRINGEVRWVFVRLCPPFSTRMDDGALAVEQEIRRRGLGGEYLAILFGVFDINLYSMGEYTDHDYDGAFKVWSATPEQRCRAALHAIGVKV